jgi:hypothetical protein
MPTEFLRGVVGIIGAACAFMAAQTVVAIRKGRMTPRRVYGWFARIALCLIAVAIKHPVDLVDIIVWSLCVLAFAGGWWQASHEKPPEDLSSQIFPDE